MGDFNRLMELHKEVAGDGPGRKYNVAVLNKAAVLMLFASWECYCEDAVSEFHGRIVTQAGTPSQIPTAVKKYTLQAINGATKNELAFWELVGDSWRSKLRAVLSESENRRNREFNTPRPDIVDLHFEVALGVKNISSAWHWRGMSKDQAAKKLRSFIELRGSIAHRLGEAKSIRRNDVEGYGGFIRQLVKVTDALLVEKYNSRSFMEKTSTRAPK